MTNGEVNHRDRIETAGAIDATVTVAGAAVVVDVLTSDPSVLDTAGFVSGYLPTGTAGLSLREQVGAGIDSVSLGGELVQLAKDRVPGYKDLPLHVRALGALARIKP